MIQNVSINCLEPQTTSFKWMEMVISTHFSLVANHLKQVDEGFIFSHQQ